MRVGLLTGLILIVICNQITAQQVCSSFDYQQKELLANPAFNIKVSEIEEFIKHNTTANASPSLQRSHLPLITIPVVIHILYNNDDENVPDVFITNQLAMLNQCFRRLNADSVNTPGRFQGLAADCDIEFKLAVSDPQRRPTTGVIRKYTSIKRWEGDDKVKFASKGGSDAWNTGQYLNIWICNLKYVLGYASFPGGAAEKDGIVMNYSAFKWQKTIVHEAGHWMGLRHVWGDSDCGDDLVHDTPKQMTSTYGCPSGIRITCNNGPDGDMYMNYMDVTDGGCTNLFTEGQKMRMRSLFDEGGVRSSLLSSHALLPPSNNEIPLPEPEDKPKQRLVNIYPNPAIAEITLDLPVNQNWVGSTLQVSSVQGITLLNVKVTSHIMKVNVSSLKPGVYFITGKPESGTTIKQKLVKI